MAAKSRIISKMKMLHIGREDPGIDRLWGKVCIGKKMYLQQNQGLSPKLKYHTWRCNHCERDILRKGIYYWREMEYTWYGLYPIKSAPSSSLKRNIRLLPVWEWTVPVRLNATARHISVRLPSCTPPEIAFSFCTSPEIAFSFSFCTPPRLILVFALLRLEMVASKYCTEPCAAFCAA